jgi:hypothetical protein
VTLERRPRLPHPSAITLTAAGLATAGGILGGSLVAAAAWALAWRTRRV